MFSRLAIAAIAFAAAAPAIAADLPTSKPAPFAPAIESWNPWVVRVRALAVLPEASARVSSPAGRISGASVKITNSVVPEVDISYFFTKNFAVEAICCVTPHKISAKGSIAALGKVGEALLFPPTVVLQYHFTELGAFKPYVGVGVNYTHFFNTKAGPGFTGLKIRDSWGVAGQVGFDYMIDRHWGFNFDVKRIFMETKATTSIGGGAVPISAKVKINPWLIGTGVTYRF